MTHKFREPLLVNACLVLLLGILCCNVLINQSLQAYVLLMLGIWTIALANACLFVQRLFWQRLSQDERQVRQLYGFLALASFILAWVIWSR